MGLGTLASAVVRAALGAGVVCVTLASLCEWLGTPRPPPLGRPPPVLRAQDEATRVDRPGHRLIRVAGPPFVRGRAAARALADDLPGVEHAWLHGLRAALPDARAWPLWRIAARAWLIGYERQLTVAERREIAGLSHEIPATLPELGSHYGQLAVLPLAREALTRLRAQEPGRLVGVTAPSGAVLLGLNAAPEVGADHAEAVPITLSVVQPPPGGGLGFVAVRRPAEVGALAGINAVRLAVVALPEGSATLGRAGTPASVLVTRILAHAASIAQARDLLREVTTAGPTTLALADATGRLTQVTLRGRGELESADVPTLVACATSRPASGGGSIPGAGADRRLRHLVAASAAPWTAREVLRLLRDRQGPQGQGLPLGHRLAVDNLSAPASLILDPRAGLIYLGEGPHTLGSYAAYDTDALLRSRTAADLLAAARDGLPADATLTFYPLVAEARRVFGRIDTAIRGQRLADAERLLPRTAVLGDHPTTLRLRGELALAKGDRVWAVEFFRQALVAPPESDAEAALLASRVR